MSDASPNPLWRAVTGPHATLDELAREAARHHTSRAREAFEVIDAYISVAARHLAAMEATVVPVVRHRLSDGRARVHEYLRDARDLEQTVHLLKARSYGDVQVHGLTREHLWHEIARHMTSHLELEHALVRDLAATLSEQEATELAADLVDAAQKAPTRPHPLTPHTGPLGAVSRRLWRFADSFWDTAEGRVVPHRPKPRHPREGSLLTRYVMGAPTFDERERRTE